MDLALDTQRSSGTESDDRTEHPGRPLAYGYMLVPSDTPDDDVRDIETALRVCAEAHGLRLGTTFTEIRHGARTALDDLRLALLRTGTRYVIAPSSSHFAESHLLQAVTTARLHSETGAEVVTVADSGPPPGHDPVSRRYRCVWCDEPDAWPDGCVEAPDRLSDRCAEMIKIQCTLGDHRRCATSSCVVAARWHAPVRRAGVAAADLTGASWAVTSTIENRAEVVGTSDDLRAAVLLRTRALRHAGAPLGPEGRGLVYVVRGSDGALF